MEGVTEMIFVVLTIIPLLYLLCAGQIHTFKRGAIEYSIFAILFLLALVLMLHLIDLLLLLNLFSLALFAKYLLKGRYKNFSSGCVREVGLKCLLPAIVIYAIFLIWLQY